MTCCVLDFHSKACKANGENGRDRVTFSDNAQVERSKIVIHQFVESLQTNFRALLLGSIMCMRQKKKKSKCWQEQGDGL